MITQYGYLFILGIFLLAVIVIEIFRKDDGDGSNLNMT